MTSVSNDGPKWPAGRNIGANIASSTKTMLVFDTKSITSLAASTAALLISTTWHMPVFIAIAEKGVISLQSMPGRATRSGCFIPAATGGAIISVSVLGSSSR